MARNKPVSGSGKNFDHNEFREFRKRAEYFRQTLPVSFHNQVSVYRECIHIGTFCFFFNLTVLYQVNVIICYYLMNK